MKFILNFRNRYFFFWDLLTIPAVVFLAFVVRLGSARLEEYVLLAVVCAVVAVSLKLALFMATGLYSRDWIFASLPETILLLKNALLGELAFVAVIFPLIHWTALPPLPRSIPFLDLFFTLLVVAGPRFGLRWLYGVLRRNAGVAQGTLRRVLIVGAGEAGNLILREIGRNPQLGLRPLGFVDDDPGKKGQYIGQCKVLGTVSEIPALTKEHHIQQVLIAIPSAPAQQLRRVVEVCQEAGVETQILPGMFDLLSGRVEIQRLRPVRLEDLLARDPVKTDTTQVQMALRGKRVLVTGAGGSIGSELCRQIAESRPASLILLGHGENSIFHSHNELCRTFPGLLLSPVIADIRDKTRLRQVFERFRPEMIFHAAAHKHVPLMEANPEEAVTNNVLGTRNLLRLAEENGVSHFVMISTDKAVYPTSMMGATKRVAERLVVEAARRCGQHFVAVRFGNVLGSRGSVVPFFQEQIARGGPITVTHPEVKRYFMTTTEAVQLVLQASALGKGGEIFVLDMGEPVKIVDLARDMIRLARLKEGEDIEIVFTGLRPGEKLFEELFLEEETHHRTVHEKIFISQNGRGNCSPMEQEVDSLLAAARQGDQVEIVRLIRAIVPECDPAFGVAAISKAL